MPAAPSPTPTSVRHDLLQALREQMIPRLTRLASTSLAGFQNGQLSLIHVAEPLRDAPGIAVSRRFLPHEMALAAPPLSAGRLSRWRWPAAHLHAIEFPYMGCVVEGEADLRVAATPPDEELCARNGGLAFEILTLRAGSWFLLPPGTLHPDSVLPHWEREAPELARATIFWIHLLPVGALCHTCTTRGLKHEPQPSVLVPDARLSTIAEILFEEAKTRQSHSPTLVLQGLLSLLLRIERGMATKKPSLTHEDVQAAPAHQTPQAVSPGVERACAFIESHLHEEIAPADIAACAHVSVPHLNRLFRAELQMSVMEFVTEKRLQMAESLLENSDLPVGEISRLVGYGRASHFNQAFARRRGCTPSAHRALHQTSAKTPQAKTNGDS